MQKIDGGYALISKETLSHLNAQISSRSVSLLEGRGMVGLLSMLATRKAAEASASKLKAKTERKIFLTPQELSRVAKIPLKISKKVFKNEFVLKEKGKLVPVPRRLLKFLAQCEKRSVFLTLLTYIERGLSLERGRIKNAGTAKASLIARETKLSLRSVRLARAELLALGIITPDTTKYQRKLNRDGAYFTINLSWENPLKPRKQIAVSKSQIAPLPIKKCDKIAPPYREIKPSPKGELRNQKTFHSGVFSKREGEGKVILPPTIRNVQRIDLEQFSRCRTLYHQACEAKLIKHSEASYLNFVAAAVRAKSSKHGIPEKIFMGIIRKNLWINITQEQEDRARAAIKKYDS